MNNNLNELNTNTSGLPEQQVLQPQKKAFLSNKTRMIIILIDAAVSALFAVSMAIPMIFAEGSEHNIITALLTSLWLTLTSFASWAPGIIHLIPLFKKLLPLLKIIFLGWLIFIAISYFAIVFGGAVFLIIDIIKIIQKKPLYFSWELSKT